MSDGFRHLPGFLSPARQAALLQAVHGIVAAGPWVVPTMPRSGRPFSVRMANAGPLGWVSDRRGYRYQPLHPETGRPWPPIPSEVLEVWQEVAQWPQPPQCCLVNLYRDGARMGQHQDRDERDLAAPVVSVSLGDRALFRLGGTGRRDPGRSFWLESGDVVVLGGTSRLAFHGIDRVEAGSSGLVPGGGRLNLTLRRVTVHGPDPVDVR